MATKNPGKTSAREGSGAGAGRSLKGLWKKVEGVQIAMLTTIDEDGGLHSRPMATQAVECEEYLYFFAARDAGKVEAIRAHEQVGVVYADPGRSLYVMASGRASIDQDAGRAAKYWSPAAQAWFPGGPEDSNLVLIKVDVDHAQWWDGNRSIEVDLSG